MRRGGTGPGDGDVGQGGEVVQCEALIVEIGAQLAVAHPRFDRHRARLRVERDHLIHRLEGDEGVRTVGDAVEAMARAERLQGIVLLDELANLFDRRETMQVVRAVSVVAGPVGELAARRGVVGRPAEESGPGRSAQDRGRELEEHSLVHDRNPSRGWTLMGRPGSAGRGFRARVHGYRKTLRSADVSTPMNRPSTAVGSPTWPDSPLNRRGPQRCVAGRQGSEHRDELKKVEVISELRPRPLATIADDPGRGRRTGPTTRRPGWWWLTEAPGIGPLHRLGPGPRRAGQARGSERGGISAGARPLLADARRGPSV